MNEEVFLNDTINLSFEVKYPSPLKLVNLSMMLSLKIQAGLKV